MNIGYYGHTNTIVFTYTKDSKFIKEALYGGMRGIHRSAQASIKAGDVTVQIGLSGDNANSNDYRKDYYGLRQFIGADKKLYHGIGRYLGYEDGENESNIFSDLPDGPIDLLFVWDEGYGGLKLPDSKHIFWASDKTLPNKEQFDKIATNCFLLLDGDLLRKAGAMISRQISWERTVSELISEIQNNPAISYLLKARQLLIPFGLDGAVYILPKDNNSGQLEAALILTHGDVEGAVAGKSPDALGGVFVFSSMAAALVSGIATLFATMESTGIPLREADDAFAAFLELAVSRIMENEVGSSKVTENMQANAVRWSGILRMVLEAGETIAASTTLLGEDSESDEDTTRNNEVKIRDWAAFPIPLGEDSKVPADWTVVNNVGNRQIYDVAFDYVQNGPLAIEGLPQFSLGAFTTVDRWEIESYQNIGNLILQYANTDSVRPLSIAVFGSPGSGKSFGVTQIAKNILPGKVEKLEFNVSQFLSHIDLAVAFQKVRDVILEGKLPLVFFDEFDSDKDGVSLGWVKSFLMPMQDGRFRDDSGEHPLGKCILVFAGGTAPNFEEFIAPMSAKDADVRQGFKNIKGPDFVSRLKGTINVLGPNPKNSDDKNYILRRALLLRGLCERKLAMQSGKAPVSPVIIRAMLQVPEYKHGARSMEAIMDMSRIEGGIFEPAALPFHTQLALHVDADAFLKLILSNEDEVSC